MRLNAEVTKVLAMPEVKDFLFNHGLDPAPGTPEQFGEVLRSHSVRWGAIIRQTGAKID